MKYLKIRNWDRWQSYRKDRGQPPWIKLHRDLMRNVDWVLLSDSQRGQLVAIWLLAADRDGVIPASPQIIKKICHLDKLPDLKLFIKSGFIEPDVIVTPSGCQDDSPEVEVEVEVEVKNNRSKLFNFDQVWKLYPEKIGKAKASLHFKAQVKTDEDFTGIQTAIENYKAHVAAVRLNGHPDRRYQHGATFFNNYWRDWVNPEVDTGEDAHSDRMKQIEEDAREGS